MLLTSLYSHYTFSNHTKILLYLNIESYILEIFIYPSKLYNFKVLKISSYLLGTLNFVLIIQSVERNYLKQYS